MKRERRRLGERVSECGVCVHSLIHSGVCLCVPMARPDRSRRVHYVLIEISRGHIELTSNLCAHCTYYNNKNNITCYSGAFVHTQQVQPFYVIMCVRNRFRYGISIVVSLYLYLSTHTAYHKPNEAAMHMEVEMR